MNMILLLPLLVSFLICLFLTPFWIRKAKDIDLLWEDMNKPGHPKNVAGSGGIVPIMAAVIGIFLYVAVQTFILGGSDDIQLSIFAIASSLLLVAGIGLIDDLFGGRKGVNPEGLACS